MKPLHDIPLLAVPLVWSCLAVSQANAQPVHFPGTGNYYEFVQVVDDGVWAWAVGPEVGVQLALFGTPTPSHDWAR